MLPVGGEGGKVINIHFTKYTHKSGGVKFEWGEVEQAIPEGHP